MEDIFTPESLSDISKHDFDPRPVFFIRHWSWILGLLFMFPILMGFIACYTVIPLLFDQGSFNLLIERQGDIATMILCLAIYLCKDALNGQSISKRTVRLQIINNSTGAVASPMQTFVRNLTFLLFPLELIMMSINPSRRLGDYIANTRLERYGIYTITQKKYKLYHTIPVFILSLASTSVLYWLCRFLKTSFLQIQTDLL